MVQILLVGLVAGVAAALLFVAPFGGTPLAVPLFALTGLPIAIAGFGWGNRAAVTALAAGAALTYALASWNGATVFVFLFAIPVAWATIVAVQPTTTADGRGWRPLGLVLAHTACALAIDVLALGVLVGFNPPALTDEITQALIEWAASANPDTTAAPTAADVAPLVRLYVALLPATVAIMGMAMVVLDLYLGAKSVGFSERMKRTLQPLWTLSLPVSIPAAFVVATGLAFAPGSVGYAAEAVAGALGAAVTLQGLAVIHALSRGISWRAPMLAALYALIFLSGLPVLLCALLGLAESAFHLRARRVKPRTPSQLEGTEKNPWK
jgi:hypothetical protein